jgi:hypothetical protein
MRINEIRAFNKAHGHHFFDRETLQFFNSLVYPNVRATPRGDGWYFITSEQFAGPRKFTLRVCWDDGDCITAPMTEQGQFDTFEQAYTEMIRMSSHV